MTSMAKPDFVLSAAEFDLVHGDLRLGRVPFPLEVPSHGATMSERAELTAEAYRALAERGLAAGGQLNARLEELLRLLASPDVAVDAVGHAGQPYRALAAANSHVGVLARIVADELWVTEIRPSALARSGRPPAARPGCGTPRGGGPVRRGRP